MKASSNKSVSRNSTIFILAVVTLMAFAICVLPVASDSSRSIISTDSKVIGAQKQRPALKRGQALSASGPNAPLAPSVTATLADSFTDADGDSKAEPGQTVNYTVVINNGGPDPATGVAYSEPIDAITTLVAGSVHASPLAVNETYNWVGNTVLDTSARALSTVTANDVAINPPGGTDTFALTTLTNAATALGGTVTLAANGHFVYTPPLGRPNAADGASVNDSFNYTLTSSADATLTATGTVTIALTGRVWYLQAGAAGNGRSATPSGNPATMSTSADKASDIFYVFSSGSNLNGAFTLDSGQQLLGQGVNLVVNSITLFTAGSAPTITNTGGNAVTLNNTNGSNTISGLTVGNSSGIGITGTNFGTLTVSSTAINNANPGQALLLNNGTVAGTGFTSVSATGGTNNISLTSIGGTLALGSGALSGATANAFDVNGGAGTISYSGTIMNSGGRQVSVINKTGGIVTLSGAISGTGTGVILNNNTGATNTLTGGLTLSTGTSGALVATGGGTVNITGSTNDITTTTGVGVQIAGVGIGASGVALRNITVSGAASNGIILSTTSGAFQVSGTTNIGTAGGSGPTWIAINIVNYSSGTISFGAVNINQRGTTGILLNNFDGASATFGATTIPNQNNSGGYGIRVEDSAAAVTIATATISNANQTVAQTDTNNDAIPDSDGDGDAIFLKNNTGSFTLNGGTLLNNGADGIDIRTAQNLTLLNVTINGVGSDVSGSSAGGVGGHGVFGLNLTGTNSLTGITITNWETAATNGLRWWNQSGTGTLTLHGCNFTNSETGSGAIIYRADNTAVMTLNVGGTNAGDPNNFTNIFGEAIGHAAGNSAGSSGTANLTVQNNTFMNTTVKGQNSISARNVEAGKATVVISGNTFDGVGRTQADTSGVIDIGADGLLAGNQISFTITGNTIKNIGDNITNSCGSLPCTGKRAIDVFIDDNGNVNGAILIDSNIITNVQRNGIIFDTGSTFNGANFTAKITNNRVGIRADNTIDRVGIGTALSAGGESGIRIENRNSNTKNLNILVSSNLIYNGNGGAGSALNGSGIFLRAQNSATLSATVTNNTVNTNNSSTSNALRADTNFSASGTATLCVDASGNSLTALSGADDISLGEIQGVLNIEQASLAALATANPGSTASTLSGSPQFGVACSTPPSFAQVPDAGQSVSQYSSPPEGGLPGLDEVKQNLPPSGATGLAQDQEVGLKDLAAKTEEEAANSAPTPQVVASASPEYTSLAPLLGGAKLMHAAWIRGRTLPGVLKVAVLVPSQLFEEASPPAGLPQESKKGKELQGMGLSPSAPNAPQAGETITTTIGTLPANKSVTIKFQVTIPDPAGVTQISTRGTVSGTNFSNVLTTDPGPPVVNGPTVTLVDLVDTTTSLATSGSPVTAGQAVTLTATVARTTGSAGTITGTVQFKDGASNLGSPVTITAGQAQLTTMCLTTGSHSITAVYNGDVNFKTSTSSPSQNVTVNAATPVFVDDTFAGSTDCQDLGSGKIFGRNAFATITAGIAGVAAGGTVNVADGTYAESVTLSAATTVALSGNVTINDSLTISNGTFTSTSGVLSITGNFTHSAGTFTHNSGTVTLNGAAAQTLGGTVQTAFNILEINNSMGVSLGVDKSVATQLKLTNGNLNAGTNTLSLSASATIMRTAGHVLGNLKKTFSAIGPFTYHVGTANGYSPVDVNITAGTGDLTVKAVQGPQPALTASMVLQRYWTLAGTGITANLVFNYLQADVMGTEANYRVIRVSSGTAVSFPNACPTAPCVDAAANTAKIDGVSSFSDWTAGDFSGPTAVEFDSFEARRYDRGTFIEWRTGSEVDNLGFNLYRDESGRRTRLTPELIAGSALTVGRGTRLGAGKSYAWWDGGSGAQYWLESLDLDGNSTWHGPFTAKSVGGTPPARSQAAFLSGLGQAQTGLTRPVEPTAALNASAEAAAPVQNDLAAGRAVKLSIKREGFYRVTAEQLFAAGLDRSVDPRFLQMFTSGQPLPISVVGEKDGHLDSSDAVEFYGVGLDTASTDARVYWLVSGTQFGMRIPQVQEPGLPTPRASFAYSVERKDRTVYFSALRNGERENFFGAVIARTPVEQSLSLEHLDTTSRDTAVVEVALQGVTGLPHKVGVQLNGAEIGEVAFDGQAQGNVKLTVAQALLKEGANTVTLTPLGGDSDVSLVDYIRVIYQHLFTADGDALRFALTGRQQATIDGFSSSDVRVIDVTDPGAVQEVVVIRAHKQKGGYAVTFTAPGAGERRLMAFAINRTVSPAAITQNQPSSLRDANNGADLLIVARRDFFSGLEPLAALRQRQGLSVNVVDVEDIFDEFNFGEKSAQAIKEFLSYAATRWKKKPAFVLLAADASLDPKNYLGFGDGDIVPTKLIDTQLMEAASDDWFADFNGDGLAEMSVGRLPARTAEEVGVMVTKIVNYENTAPSEEVLLVADINSGYDFEGADAELRKLIPATIRVQEINRGQMDAATAKGQLIEAINRGQKIVNYTGHGSVTLWSGNLLTSEDARELTNGNRLAVFVMMTCLNGYFQDAGLDSLSEALMKAERGGAVAVWTSSGMTEPGGQALINQEMYRQMFDRSNARLTLGEATRRAKQVAGDTDIRRSWILLGDPTMKLR